MIERIPLEQAAVELCNASAVPPLIFELPPEEGRKRLNEAQNTPVFKEPASISTLRIKTTNGFGEFILYCVVPENITGTPHMILYIHGAGWVFGNFHTHEKLVRELAARTNSVVLFPEYSLSPEVKYPVALEQCYGVLSNLPAVIQQFGLEARLDTLTVAGDSVGGNMATALTILSKYRNGPRIHKQLLFYPVTNAYFDTESYREFAEGYYLYRDGMKWFWDQYTTLETDRNQITASPLRATAEQLRGLPPALVITDEADVLRDEGEAYAKKLLEAGVDTTAVRVLSIVHDFVMLNALDETNGCRAAMDSATSWLNRKNMQ
ncbi:MAG: alpha/beta hydrolase [Oscillospiraceae bacterium]|nr:alpha/beta hydrolase [Oscillospiraceae bacterium]